MKNIVFNSLDDAYKHVNSINENKNSDDFAILDIGNGSYHVRVYSGFEKTRLARSIINKSMLKNLYPEQFHFDFKI